MSAVSRMSLAPPTAKPQGLCTIMKLFSGISMVSPAIATSDAADAARPSTRTLTFLPELRRPL